MVLIYTKKAFRKLIWEPFLNTGNMRETFKNDKNYVWLNHICDDDPWEYLISVKSISTKGKDGFRHPEKFIIEPYAPTAYYTGYYDSENDFSKYMLGHFHYSESRDKLLKYYTDLEKEGA